MKKGLEVKIVLSDEEVLELLHKQVQPIVETLWKNNIIMFKALTVIANTNCDWKDYADELRIIAEKTLEEINK